MEPKIYLVGGAVRDLALGLTPKDRDYVVVGATPEWMIQKGFKQVGSSFPVFLHPTTGEEYALARTERKVGTGYYGFETVFDPSITLEQDLMRRDLTINAMAMAIDGDRSIIDPFGGYDDLDKKTLRHTSEAFSEDPLRVLRVARFAARYNFDVANETVVLCSKIVKSGELDTLSKERVWIELYKGSTEANPMKMLQVLNSCGALQCSPVQNYVGHSPIFYVGQLFTAAEKLKYDHWMVSPAIIFAQLANMNEKTVHDLKVPTAIMTLVKRVMMTVEHLLKDPSEAIIASYITHSRLDSDSSSDSWSRWKQVQDIAMLYAYVHGRVDVLINNLDLVNKAIAEIKKIDFETLVATCEKPQIKQSVAAAKQSAIARAFKEQS